VRSVISLRECAYCLKCRRAQRPFRQATVAGYGNEGAVNLREMQVGLEVCSLRPEWVYSTGKVLRIYII
jgi:hypothetical protein